MTYPSLLMCDGSSKIHFFIDFGKTFSQSSLKKRHELHQRCEKHSNRGPTNELNKEKSEIMEIEKDAFVSDNSKQDDDTDNQGMNKNTFAINDSLKIYPEIKPFSCKYCDKSFLYFHEVKKHIESEVEEEKTKGATKNSWLLDHEIQEKKDHERKKPLNYTNLNPSKKNNKNTEIPSTRSNTVKDLVINTSPKHTCGTCGISFAFLRNLQVHIISVHEVFPSPMVGTLKCNYCNKGFSTIFNMNKHMRVVHKACPLCNVVFSTQKSLSEHKLAEHSIKCPTCGITVKNKKGTLAKHSVIHKEKKKGEENEIVSEGLPLFQEMKKRSKKT
jgi:hypothetical protein